MTRRSPIAFPNPPSSAARLNPPVCIACAEGDHERALRVHERCTCPCHGVAIPQAVAA
jgi:hypothetical protein